ncbi:MAG TPA: hypothetical protein VMU48_17785 [Terracidiphilus sp.]|nr:hypothetical protein [Terracidiphilus sp.]
MTDAGRPGTGEPDSRVLSPLRVSTRDASGPRETSEQETSSQSPARPDRPFEPVRTGATAGQAPQPIARAGKPSGFQRSVSAIRMVIPLVQKVLPLLDGNIASAVSNLLVPQSHVEPMNLAPLENAVVKLHGENVELRNRMVEQNTLLKRVGDQLDLVKEATERNSIGQQELLDDLHSLRKKVRGFAWAALVLLVISIAINVVLFLRVERMIP